jgi:hypothetical protein
VAYRTVWRFLKPENNDLVNQIYEIGTLGVDQEMPLPWEFDTAYPRLQTRMMVKNDIRVECMDDAGRLYYTVARMNDQGDFITRTDRVDLRG